MRLGRELSPDIPDELNAYQRPTTDIRTVDELPEHMTFDDDQSKVTWYPGSLKLVEPTLYLIGWAQTGSDGLRCEHRQLVPQNDILQHVT